MQSSLSGSMPAISIRIGGYCSIISPGAYKGDIRKWSNMMLSMSTYEPSTRFRNVTFKILSSSDSSIDGEKCKGVHHRLGYSNCTQSGLLTPVITHRLVIPIARLPPAESPTMMILPNTTFRYFSQ